MAHRPIEIADLPNLKMVMFHGFLYVYQGVPFWSAMIVTHDWSEYVDGLNIFSESWDKLVICRYFQ